MSEFVVFISSKTDEFAEERKKLKELENDLHLKVFIFEDDVGAQTYSTEKVYIDEVKNCKIYVGLFKYQYSEPTKKEYLIAQENRKDTLIYLEETSIHNKQLVNGSLKEFIDNISSKHVYDKFKNPDDLYEKLKKRIQDILKNSYTYVHNIELNEFEFINENFYENQLENSNDWKKGVPLNFTAIKLNKHFERQSFFNNLIKSLEFTNVLFVRGKKGYSKTTLLRELINYFYNKNHLCFYLDGSISTIDNHVLITGQIKKLLETRTRILIAIDNLSPKNYSVFSIIYEILSHKFQNNIRFVVSISPTELSDVPGISVFNYTQDNAAELMNLSVIGKWSSIVLEKAEIMDVPAFTKREIKEIIEKYDNKKYDDVQIDQYSTKIIEVTGGCPMLVFQSIFNQGLKNSILEKTRNYLTDDKHYTASIICSILSISEIKISDELLEMMEIDAFTKSLKDKILFKNNGIWNTIHQKWDEDFLNLVMSSEKKFFYLEEVLAKILKVDECKVYRILLTISEIFWDLNSLHEVTSKIEDTILNLKSCRLKANILIHIGSLYQKSKNYPEAMKFIDKGLEIDSDNAVGHDFRGQILYATGKFPESVDEHTKAIELYPNQGFFYINLINALKKSNKIERIEDVFNKGKDLLRFYRQPLAVLYNNYAITFFSKYDFNSAEKFLNTSISIYETDVAYLNLGIIRFYNHQYEKALEFFEKGLKLDPNYSSLLEFKINSLKMLDKDKEAEEVFKHLQKIDPKFYPKLRKFYKKPKQVWRNFFLLNDWWYSFPKVPDIIYE